MEASKKQLLIQLGITSGIVIILVLAIQFIAPQLEKASEKILVQRADFNFLSQATDLLPQLKSDLEKSKPLAIELNRVLPPKEQLAGFGKELADLAKKSKIEINSSLVGEIPAADGAPASTQFLLTSGVNYSAFLKFLKEVEQSRFFVKINSLNMTRQQSGDKYNIAANVQVFHQ